MLTYLRDHLAGARGALELLEHLREHTADQEIRIAGDNFHSEIAADREVLEQLTLQLGGGTSIVKEDRTLPGSITTASGLGLSTSTPRWNCTACDWPPWSSPANPWP